MNRQTATDLKKAHRSLVHVGALVDDISISNPGDGPRWKSAATAACALIRKSEPRIAQAELNGSLAHFSTKDKGDQQKVLTVRLRGRRGTQVGSVHVHVDGTWKYFPNLVGREDGYTASIGNENIPGNVSDSRVQSNAA